TTSTPPLTPPRPSAIRACRRAGWTRTSTQPRHDNPLLIPRRAVNITRRLAARKGAEGAYAARPEAAWSAGPLRQRGAFTTLIRKGSCSLPLPWHAVQAPAQLNEG